MLKILIVDDEQKVCWLIEQKIQWSELKAECVGVASNGVDALRAVEELRPDIVITDIRMPDMDGLSLVRQGKEVCPECVFVVISGYAQFDYAHTAIRYGVADFLLKPIDAKELNDVLRKIAEKQYKKTNLHEQYVREQCAAKEREQKARIIVRNLIQGPELSRETRACIPARYPAGAWRCAAIRVEQDPQNCSAEAETFLYSRLYSVIQSLFDQTAFAYLALCDTGYLLLILNGPGEEELARIAWKKIHSAMLEEIRGFGGTQAVIALSGVTLSVGPLCASARQARALLQERLAEPEAWLIEPAGKRRPETAPPLGKQELVLMENAAAVLDADACREILGRVFSFAAGTVSKDGAAACSMAELLFDCYLRSISEMAFISEEERKADKDQWELLLRNVTGFEMLRSVMTQFLTERLAHYRKKKEQMDSRPVLQAKNWIEAHTESLCTLQEVSAHVCISPTYLSTVFKEETGVNFKDYVIEVKMAKARQLLAGGDEKVSAVAQMVGYQDVKYFSRLFEKIVGLKPAQYRKLMR